MKRDETIQFLTMRGWVIFPNRPDNKVVVNKYWDMDLDPEEDAWCTIEDALECERMDSPDSFLEYDMVAGLDSKSFQMYKEYLDD